MLIRVVLNRARFLERAPSSTLAGTLRYVIFSMSNSPAVLRDLLDPLPKASVVALNQFSLHAQHCSVHMSF